MNLSTLRRHKTYWQKKLRLQDWQIDLHWADEAGLKETESAVTKFFPADLQATVYVRRPEDMDPSDGWLENYEGLVLHELLHIRIEGHREDDQVDMNLERAINILVELLLKLKRS